MTELHYWLRAFRGRISKETGIDLGAGGSSGTGETSAWEAKGGEGGGGGKAAGRRARSVPVFLFDLVRTEPLLLVGSYLIPLVLATSSTHSLTLIC